MVMRESRKELESSATALAFQGFYSEAALPYRRCSQHDLDTVRSRWSEARPRYL